MSLVKLINNYYPVERLPGWITRPYIWIVSILKQKKINQKIYLPFYLYYLKRKKGLFTYTVVTPVYNSAAYLDNYFCSLTRQTLIFDRHINLVLIDDGSTDDSRLIMEKWQRKYPNNITCFYQKKSGQGCARNKGLENVKTEWVTFIDADDFVEPEYFRKVDDILRKMGSDKIKLLCCKQLMFYEYMIETADKHPLRIYFQDEISITHKNDLQQKIVFSVASSFFLHKELQRQKLQFLDAAFFEDAHFILSYLSNITEGYNVFTEKPKYYFTKRKDKSAISNIIEFDARYYGEVLEEGILGILEHYHRRDGSIPEFVQRTVLYYMSFFIKSLSLSNKKIAFLTEIEKERLYSLSIKIFDYIDIGIINSFDSKLSGLTYFHKLGIIFCLKKINIYSKYAYVDKLDIRKQQMRIRMFVPSSLYSLVMMQDRYEIFPTYYKLKRSTYITSIFYYELYVWVKIEPFKKLYLSLNNERQIISINAIKYKYLSYDGISSLIASSLKSHPLASRSSPWLIMDRDTQADDNAEHFYRYMMKHHPEQKIYFVLRKTSHDWPRLSAEGFNLIDFLSPLFFKVLKAADKLISSHYIFNVLKKHKQLLKNKLFIFLQHGITVHDISFSTNQMDIDLFICATQSEYNSIVSQGSPYILSEKEVALTGFARHDSLFHMAQSTPQKEKIILMMPTWRIHIVGKRGQGTFERSTNDAFHQTDYFKSWMNLLTSQRLEELLKSNGYRIIFFPHFATQEYFKNLEITSDVVQINSHKTSSIQKLLVDASFMITDYSSIAFEMAFLRKGIIYYQFDAETFYDGLHYQIGYFNYKTDGFGEIINDQTQLIKAIERLMHTEGIPEQDYLDRMIKAFPLRDGKSSERIYKKILDIE